MRLNRFDGFGLLAFPEPETVRYLFGPWSIVENLPLLKHVVRCRAFGRGRDCTVRIRDGGHISAFDVQTHGPAADPSRATALYAVVGHEFVQAYAPIPEHWFLARRLGENGRFVLNGDLIRFAVCAVPDPVHLGHIDLEYDPLEIVGILVPRAA